MDQVTKFLFFQNASGDSVNFKIYDSYGKTRNAFKTFHAGWDIVAEEGTSIKWVNLETAESGKKDYWAWRGNPDRSNLGYHTIIYTHERKFKLKFCHLQGNEIWNAWQENSILATGQTVGNIGISGRPSYNLTSPVHLHMEVYIKIGDGYKHIDPLAYFMLSSCYCNTVSCDDTASSDASDSSEASETIEVPVELQIIESEEENIDAPVGLQITDSEEENEANKKKK